MKGTTRNLIHGAITIATCLGATIALTATTNFETGVLSGVGISAIGCIQYLLFSEVTNIGHRGKNYKSDDNNSEYFIEHSTSFQHSQTKGPAEVFKDLEKYKDLPEFNGDHFIISGDINKNNNQETFDTDQTTNDLTNDNKIFSAEDSDEMSR